MAGVEVKKKEKRQTMLMWLDHVLRVTSGKYKDCKMSDTKEVVKTSVAAAR